jgi:hypothetical protein
MAMLLLPALLIAGGTGQGFCTGRSYRQAKGMFEQWQKTTWRLSLESAQPHLTSINRERVS